MTASIIFLSKIGFKQDRIESSVVLGYLRKLAVSNVSSHRLVGLQSKNWPIADLPGLEIEDCQHLTAIGLHTTKDLLHYSKSPSQQMHLAKQLRLHIHHIQKWRALADLARIPAVGQTYCGLLLHAGVPSVRHLASLAPGRLHRQILKLQVAAIQRTDLCPNAGLVQQWIEQAKQL